MSEDDRFDELLSEWERRRQVGEEVSPFELAQGEADLAKRLQDAIARLLLLERFLGQDAELIPHATISSQPDRVGEYVIIEELARGGSGTVYRARQESLNRDVALKLLRATDRRQRTLSRFQRETRAMTVIRHPRIAQVFDAGAVDLGNGLQPYLVMEFLDGWPLDAWLLRHTVDLQTRLELFDAICDGVRAAHARGIIHRDLKPSNILVGVDGQPKICDFGIARILDSDSDTQSRITASTEIVGTIQYMSPEHVSGPSHFIDARSDIYSLGLILFELVTEERPYDTSSQTVYAAIDLIRTSTPPPVRRLNSALHRDLETIVSRCLEKDPDRRYQSVESLRQDVQRYLQGDPIAARPAGSLELLQRLTRRHPVTAAAIFSAALILLAGIAVSLHFASVARQAAHDAETQSLAAKVSEARAIELQTEAVEQADRARRTAFNAMLGRIQRFTVTDPDLATELLDDPELCPQELRSFAWRHLKNQNITLLRVLEGHSGGTNKVRFSADGRRLLSAGNDNRLRFWEVETGELIGNLPCLSAGEPIAVSPTGDVAASSGPEGSVLLFRPERTEPWRHITPDSGSAARVCFVPTGSYLAIGTRQGTVEVWDYETRRRVTTLEAGAGIVWYLDARDPDYLTAMTSENHIAAWETITWEPVLASVVSPEARVIEVARHADWWALAHSNGRIDLFRDSGDRLGHRFASSGIVALNATQTGGSILAALPNRIEAFNWYTGSLAWLLRHEDSVVTDVAAGRDGQRQLLAVSSESGSISIHDVTSVEAAAARLDISMSTSGGQHLSDVEYSPDGTLLAVCENQGLIRLLDARTLRTLAEHDISARVTDLCWHPDGTMLAAGKLPLKNRRGDLDDGSPQLVILAVSAATSQPTGSGTTGSGTTGSVMTGADADGSGSAKTWTLKLHDVWSPTRPVSRVAYSPDGRYLVAAARADEVVVLNALTGDVQASIPVPHGGVPAFSPDSRWLVLGDSDGRLRLLSVPSGTEEAMAQTRRGAVRACVFATDGRSVYSTGGTYGEIHRWSVPELTLLATFRGPREATNAIAVSPDGLTLAIASRDHIVTLMDAETGDVQIELEAHNGPVTSLNFSPDGSTLATTGKDAAALRL